MPLSTHLVSIIERVLPFFFSISSQNSPSQIMRQNNDSLKKKNFHIIEQCYKKKNIKRKRKIFSTQKKNKINDVKIYKGAFIVISVENCIWFSVNINF
jgi:hypothetical protein